MAAKESLTDQADEPLAMAHYLASHGGVWPIISPAGLAQSPRHGTNLKPVDRLDLEELGIRNTGDKTVRSSTAGKSPRVLDGEVTPVKRAGESAQRAEGAKRYGRKGALSLVFERERAKLALQSTLAPPCAPFGQPEDEQSTSSSHVAQKTLSRRKVFQSPSSGPSHESGGSGKYIGSGHWVRYEMAKQQLARERSLHMECISAQGRPTHQETAVDSDEPAGAEDLREDVLFGAWDAKHTDETGRAGKSPLRHTKGSDACRRTESASDLEEVTTKVVRFKRGEDPPSGLQEVFPRVDLGYTVRRNLASRKVQSGLSLLLKQAASSQKQKKHNPGCDPSGTSSSASAPPVEVM